MTDVDRLLADYIAEHRAGGEADPSEYLTRASPAQRTELAALIDAYLATAPRQTFDQAAFRGSSAERTVDELDRAIAGQAGLWPALLPRLRDRAGLKRSQLVERLASALGVARPQRQGGRLLPRDGAGPPSGRWRVGRGTRRAWSDRRRDSAGAEGGRARACPAGQGPAAHQPPRSPGGPRPNRQPIRHLVSRRPRTANGTRSMRCSAAPEIRPRPLSRRAVLATPRHRVSGHSRRGRL